MWFPDWPLRLSGPPPDSPQQSVGVDNRVEAVNAAAAAAGIAVGMRRREAEALCPAVATLPRDPGAEAAAFESVAAAVEGLVPKVEVAQPGLLFVRVGGAVRYYGGEVELAERVAKEVEATAGPGALIGLAAGPFAARCAADRAGGEPYVVADDAAFLATLDVGALAGEDLAATFRWLGITTVGELARLPRAAVASRFGSEGLHLHRLAAGEDRPVVARAVPDDPAVEERFVPPLEDMEQAAFAARALAHQLLERLSVGGGLPHRVEVVAVAADGTVRSRTWRSNDPFDEAALAERVRWQLRAWVEGAKGEQYGIPGGLARLRLVPADVSDRGRQMALHEDPVSDLEIGRALARAQSLVGPDAVLQARPQGGRDPGERVRWYRWGESAPQPERDPAAPWPGRLPGPPPALVPPEPRPLEVEWDGGMPTRVRLGSRWEPVRSWAGPWRKVGRWWEGEGPADRYQIVTSAGALLCEVRDGRTRLIGVYD